MPTFGTDNKHQLPLYIRYRFGGTDIGWPQPYRINNFSNSAESVDSQYRISDLDFQIPDINGSYFATQFGRGTLGLGSSLEVIAYLGGTMDYQTHGQVTEYKLLATTGAYAATLHTGKVSSIGFKDRLLRVRSKSKLAQLSDLKWQYPVTIQGLTAKPNIGGWFIGSQVFSSGALHRTIIGSNSFHSFDNGRTKWKAHAYILGSWFHSGGGGGNELEAQYPALGGRTSVAMSAWYSTSVSPAQNYYYFPGTDSGGTSFYEAYELVDIEGTYLGTYFGTIQGDDEANSYGFYNAGAAEAAKTSGSVYVLNRTRFTLPNPVDDSHNTLHFTSSFEISGNPAQCFATLMTCEGVTPYFSTSDLDPVTLAESGTITAYHNFRKVVWFDEDKPFESLKDIFQSNQALFSVNSSNLFELRAYGPKNLTQTIPSLGTQDIISYSYSNDEEDFYNRFEVLYNYSAEHDSFESRAEAKVSAWTKATDRPLTIESKWIKNRNEAEIISQRLRLRFERTLPHISFETNLNKLGLDLGTLISITDPGSIIGSKTVQVVGFDKNWQERKIEFQCVDAEAIYQRKGFSFWMSGGTLPGGPISGTSTSGWGTAGTNPNINSTIYGSMFCWF